MSKNLNKRSSQSKIYLAEHILFEKFCEWYKDKSKLASFSKTEILNKWAAFYTKLEEIRHLVKKLVIYDKDFEYQLNEYIKIFEDLFTKLNNTFDNY